jgi:hypothetical protein
MLGKTVGEIREEMSFHELLCWIEYFQQRPHGWKEDQRTYLILSAFGVKEKPEALFPSLAVMKDNQAKEAENSKVLKRKLASFMAFSSGGEAWDINALD